MAHRTGHRKFRLSCWKNAECKKFSKVTSFSVSIPLNEAITIFKVSAPLDLLSYKVSPPLSAVTECPVRSLATLHSQTKLKLCQLVHHKHYSFCSIECCNIV